jgi:uncharacterized protein
MKRIAELLVLWFIVAALNAAETAKRQDQQGSADGPKRKNEALASRALRRAITRRESGLDKFRLPRTHTDKPTAWGDRTGPGRFENRHRFVTNLLIQSGVLLSKGITMTATRLDTRWKDAWEQESAGTLVRQIARPQPQLRCPSCKSILYTRRYKRCGVCEVELPDDLLFSAMEASRVKARRRDIQVAELESGPIVGSMKTVAIIGASNNRTKFGNKAVRAYQQQGYTVYPISLSAREVESLPAYRSILEVPKRPDMVSVYIPPEQLLKVLPDIARQGCDELWLNPGAESPEVLEEAERLGLNVIQACSILAVGLSPHTL